MLHAGIYKNKDKIYLKFNMPETDIRFGYHGIVQVELIHQSNTFDEFKKFNQIHIVFVFFSRRKVQYLT